MSSTITNFLAISRQRCSADCRSCAVCVRAFARRAISFTWTVQPSIRNWTETQQITRGAVATRPSRAAQNTSADRLDNHNLPASCMRPGTQNDETRVHAPLQYNAMHTHGKARISDYLLHSQACGCVLGRVLSNRSRVGCQCQS